MKFFYFIKSELSIEGEMNEICEMSEISSEMREINDEINEINSEMICEMVY